MSTTSWKGVDASEERKRLVAQSIAPPLAPSVLPHFKGFGAERARLGIFRGFGTERVRLGTFRGFSTERARLGTFRGFGTGLRASRAVRHFQKNLKKVSFFYSKRASSPVKTEVLPKKKKYFFTQKDLPASQKT